MPFDCIAIGDASIDEFLTLHEAEIRCKINHTDCEICLKYGEKIPIDRLDRGIGGNAINTVVGLARLGNKTALMSVHGDDQTGDLVDQTLDKEGIDRKLVISHPHTQSRHSTIINFGGERTILEYNFPHAYKLPDHFPQTHWLYVSSVGQTYKEFFAALATLVKERDISLAFTPNRPQLESPLETYLPLLQECKIAFMNKEEALTLTGKIKDKGNGTIDWKKENGDKNLVKGLLLEISRLGPAIIVVTDGQNGSYCYDGDKYYHLGVLDWPIISPTGAGDAYAAGFLAAIMKSNSTSEAMRWGTINAGAVIGQFGAQTGLVNSDLMQKYLKENPDFQPREI